MYGLLLLSALNVGLADNGGGDQVDPGSARITVRLPPGAALYVDNVPSPFTTDTQSFNTPPLAPGLTYTYVLRVTTSKGPTPPRRRIYFRAGEAVTIDFRRGDPLAAQSSKGPTSKAPASKAPAEEEPESPRPGGPAPQMLIVRMDKEGRLVLRHKLTQFVPETRERSVVDKDGTPRTETYTINVPREVEKESVHDLDEVKVFRPDGKKVDAAALSELLARETPALVSFDGRMVDPYYLQVVSAGTLIVIMPPPRAPQPFSAPKKAV